MKKLPGGYTRKPCFQTSSQMDLNYLLIWFVGASSLLSLYEIHRRKGKLYWPLFVPLILLAILLFSFPDLAGVTSFIVWLLVLYLPRQAQVGFLKHVEVSDWELASKHASFYARLNYDSDWSKLARFFKVSPLKQSPDELKRLIYSLENAPLQVALLLAIFKQAKFELVLEIIKSHQGLLEDALGLQIAIKTLGEQGQVSAMYLLYKQSQPFIQTQFDPNQKRELEVAIAAYSGDVERVRELFAKANSLESFEVQFWLMTAYVYSGRQEFKDEAAALIESLEGRLPQELLQSRLMRIESSVPGLTPGQRSELARPASNKESSGLVFRPVATYFLIAIISVGFVVQSLLDASFYSGFSFELGALVPGLVIEHDQWWRVASCIFLHAGILHLATNMFGLYILGPFLERVLGRVKYIICFFLFGIGSSLFVVLLTQMNILEQALLIGASGGVLGLVGASAAVLLSLSKHSLNPEIKEQLRLIVIILVIQTIFDLSTPQVSFPAHFGGVISGFIIATIVMPKNRRLSN